MWSFKGSLWSFEGLTLENFSHWRSKNLEISLIPHLPRMNSLWDDDGRDFRRVIRPFPSRAADLPKFEIPDHFQPLDWPDLVISVTRSGKICKESGDKITKSGHSTSNRRRRRGKGWSSLVDNCWPVKIMDKFESPNTNWVGLRFCCSYKICPQNEGQLNITQLDKWTNFRISNKFWPRLNLRRGNIPTAWWKRALGCLPFLAVGLA